MKALPKISIVIPSYNKVEYIQETLDSIVSQNYLNLEVIIQDGGSTDGTLEIIKKYAKQYPKIFSWVSKKDNGQVDAINKGMKKTIGDILSFINADDVYELNAFKEIAKAYKRNAKALWFAGKGRVIDNEGKEIAQATSFYKNCLLMLSSYSCLLGVNYLIQPSVFITNKAYKKYGGFSGTGDFVTEYDMWLKIGKAEMAVVIHRYLSKFRIEKKTKTTTMFKKLLSEDEKILKKYTKNPLTVFIHKLNNHLRILTIKGLKIQ